MHPAGSLFGERYHFQATQQFSQLIMLVSAASIASGRVCLHERSRARLTFSLSISETLHLDGSSSLKSYFNYVYYLLKYEAPGQNKSEGGIYSQAMYPYITSNQAYLSFNLFNLPKKN